MVRVDRGAETKTVSAVIPGAEGAAVIAPPAGLKVLVATKSIDFRRGAGGLAALMRANPFSGVVYVFQPSEPTASSCSIGKARQWCWWPRR